MDELTIRPTNTAEVTFRAQDVLVIATRRKQVMGLTFSGIVLGAVLFALFFPKQYKSEMELLVTHERVDPVITSQSNNAALALARLDTTEEDLNTEVQIIKSRDLLERVVLACGLDKHTSSWKRLLHRQEDEQTAVAKAVEALQSAVTAEPIKKSNLIAVRYASTNPAAAKYVLTTLSRLYLDKHSAMHHIPGAAEFFDTQAEQYRRELAEAQAELEQFNRERGTVSAQTERDNALARANEFEASLRQTQSGINEATQRINSLEDQLAKVPARMVTSDRNQDAQLVAQMREQLMNLELKRRELLAKFEPTYRPVQDLDKEIADVRKAIDSEQESPVREVTTDNNPTTLYLDSELGKARAELASLTARANSLRGSVGTYRADALRFSKTNIDEGDLIRKVKVKEQQYMLYRDKSDEARISEALDSKHIVNVAMMEAPTLPFLPTVSSMYVLALGVILAVLASLAAALTAEFLDRSTRASCEAESIAGLLAVISAVPLKRSARSEVA